jgi:plastocyanin
MTKKPVGILVAILVGVSLVSGILSWHRRHAKPPQVASVAIRQAEVDITTTGYTPATLQITPGTRVTWVNTDSVGHRVLANIHDAKTAGAELDSGAGQLVAPGASYSFTFHGSGTYGYHDSAVPTQNGQIVVKD